MRFTKAIAWGKVSKTKVFVSRTPSTRQPGTCGSKASCCSRVRGGTPPSQGTQRFVLRSMRRAWGRTEPSSIRASTRGLLLHLRFRFGGGLPAGGALLLLAALALEESHLGAARPRRLLLVRFDEVGRLGGGAAEGAGEHRLGGGMHLAALLGLLLQFGEPEEAPGDEGGVGAGRQREGDVHLESTAVELVGAGFADHELARNHDDGALLVLEEEARHVGQGEVVQPDALALEGLEDGAGRARVVEGGVGAEQGEG